MHQVRQQTKKVNRRLVFSILLLGSTLLVSLLTLRNSERAVAAGVAPTQWTYSLPRDMCPGGKHDDCHHGSPALADINGDGYDDIIAVTNNGHVVALDHNGSLLWDTDISPLFGMPAGKNEIHSSPAVADIDADGFPEIAFGVGTFQPDVCTVGGVIVLNHHGAVEPGWPVISFDDAIPPAGCPDSVFSTPALGDMDNDGDLEIIAAGFDKRIYAWHHDGSLMPGFPPSSNLANRFPTWTDLRDRLGDNTWGSPALADLDNDGYLDMVIATGEGNFDDRWGGEPGGWYCPYRLPSGWAPGYCGGSIYAFNRFGEVMPGFPRYYLEAFGSTPAIADTDGDGVPEIYVGTSRFYYYHSPDHPTYGFKIYGLDLQGRDLPGWEGGKDLGGSAPASPSIGDISGDGDLEIIIAANDLRLYAFESDGQPVAGFPMTPLTQTGKTYIIYEHGISFPLADYDSDDKMEIFVNQSWGVIVVDGNGQQLTSTNYPSDPRPTYNAEGNLFNSPAVADIDHDGRLELVATNSQVFVWDLPDSQDEVQWSGFKCDATRQSYYCQPQLAIMPGQITLLHQEGEDADAHYFLNLSNPGGGSVSWSSTSSPGMSVTPSSGTVTHGQRMPLSVSVSTSGLDKGAHQVGAIQIAPQDEDMLVSPSDQEVTLVVGDLTHYFIPLFIK